MEFPDFYVKGPTPCSMVEDPDQFFPDPEVPGSLSAANQAKKYCGDCPYREECLAWALFNNEQGVWGGTTKNERRRMKQERGKTPITELAERYVPRSGGARNLRLSESAVSL